MTNSITDINVVEDITIVEDIDMDIMLGRIEATTERPAFFKIETSRIIQTFSLHNNQNGYIGICDVIFIGAENKIIKLYSSDKKNLQLSIDIKKSYKIIDLENNKYEEYIELEPNIIHYKYCSDINGFINVINQVYYGIKDNIK